MLSETFSQRVLRDWTLYPRGYAGKSSIPPAMGDTHANNMVEGGKRHSYFHTVTRREPLEHGPIEHIVIDRPLTHTFFFIDDVSIRKTWLSSRVVRSALYCHAVGGGEAHKQ